MTFGQILLLIFVGFLCVFAVVDRICKYKENKSEWGTFAAAWEAYLDEQSRNAETEARNREE